MINACKILLVDDDKEDCEIMLDYFREIGLDKLICFMENGQRAMDYFEHLSEDASLPSLVVLDLNMPLFSGTETLLWMKQHLRFKSIPVIIFSTSENETEKRKCLSLGAVDYIVKPVSYLEGKRIAERLSTFVA